MLRSSVLERLCGPLCDAVLEQEGSDRLLAALSRTNLFLLPLDDRGEWYRFHHLFAQLLRVELEHRDPGLAPTLHRRAFAWHRDHGSVTEAIEHAVEAGAFDEAGDLIAAAWVDYVHVNRYATVLAWLERFPRERLRQDSRLLLAGAWVYHAFGATRGGGGGDRCDRAAGAARRGTAARRLQLGRGRPGHAARSRDVGRLRRRDARTPAGQPSSKGRRRAGDPLVCLGLGFQPLQHRRVRSSADAWLARVGRACAIARTVVGRLGAHWPSARSPRAKRAGSTIRRCSQRRLCSSNESAASKGSTARSYLALGAALAAQQRFEEALAVLERSRRDTCAPRVTRSRSRPG